MDRNLHNSESWVHTWEKHTNHDGKKLKQLEPTIKEEGSFLQGAGAGWWMGWLGWLATYLLLAHVHDNIM